MCNNDLEDSLLAMLSLFGVMTVLSILCALIIRLENKEEPDTKADLVGEKEVAVEYLSKTDTIFDTVELDADTFNYEELTGEPDANKKEYSENI